MKDKAGLLAQLAGKELAAAVGALLMLAVVAGALVDDQASVLAIVLVAAVSMGLGIWIASVATARRLARPLEDLSVKLAQVTGGDVPTGTAEPRRLSESIHHVEEELAGVIDELRVETALREQILASMREGVILADVTGDTIYYNQAAADMFGSSVAELLPAQLEEAGEHEFAVHHPTRRDLHSTSVRLSDGRILAVIQDETERKRVESIRRDFVSNASHELKTPVAAIMVTAETVQSALEQDPADARRFAGNLVREATRLSALVQDLLNLARLERDRSERASCDLSRLIAQEIEQIRDRVLAKGLNLSVELEENAILTGVEEDLALMVRNLLDNALSYTAEGGITVRCSSREGGYEFSVADTGVGIPTSDLERIFERFYRVDKARSRDTGGTGLGLSIVRHVAESHGGVVEVTSELGQGSTFTVVLEQNSD